MPDRDESLLYGLLALQNGFVRKNQLVEATAAWMSRPEEELRRILIERRFLLPAQDRSIQALVDEMVAKHGGARGALEAVKLPPAVAKTLGGGAGHPSTKKKPPSRDGRKEEEKKRRVVTARGEKFVLGRELGRGGVGRVMEAVDQDLGRKVALKVMLEDAPPGEMERFLWEARVTGQLEHPNIVPVHEVGLLPGSKEIFFCMKRIVGRDMHDVIHEEKWKPRRLVEAFLRVCHAVAYAHSKGVIHRDLKPANVMLGDFGEVLVVDWGLARMLGDKTPDRIGSRRERQRSRVEGRTESSGLTMEGDVLGTPEYMPPEQAAGKLSELDERSDVWSLGAILYHILTKRPPFDGNSSIDVVNRVIRNPVVPPSAVCAVPPELDRICVKALTKDRAGRYASAAALAADVEAYLEGSEDQERRDAAAGELVAKAKVEIERWLRLNREAEAASEAAKKLQATLKTLDGVETKRPVWDLQDKSKSLERHAIRAFTDANAALSSALSNVPGHREARKLKAELFWRKSLEAEDAGDENTALLNRQMAEEYNDGSLDAPLRGDGSLAVRTSAYGCRCLVNGRSVAPAELDVCGFHPWSGRLLSGTDPGAGAELETNVPGSLRVHRAACRREAAPGAEVWAFRFEEIDRRLIPCTPASEKTAKPVPEGLLEKLYGDSPYRPRGAGIWLGATPVAARTWPMGSWLLVVAPKRHAPFRVPFAVGRQQGVDLDLTMFLGEEIPEGMLPVLGGPVREPHSGRTNLLRSEARTIDDVFVARHPVRCREYAEFLNDIDAKIAERRAPRESDTGARYWPRVGGRWVVPTTSWLAQAAAEERRGLSRLEGSAGDWEEDWPILSINWRDAQAYARWLAGRAGRVTSPPHEMHWERAARGEDNRLWPWGNQFEAFWANSQASHLPEPRPVSVEKFPEDESAWGLRGMSGNARTYCLNSSAPSAGIRRACCGGSWRHFGADCRTVSRMMVESTNILWSVAPRMSAAVRLPVK